MPTVKKLQFANGTTITPPADLTLETAVKALPTYANDAAYAAAPGNTVGEGSIYLNSTLNTVRMYITGAWRTGVVAENKTDPTKKIDFDTDGSTASTTNTLDFNSTASRVYTFPDETGTVILTVGAQELQSKTIKNGFLDGTKIRNGALDVEAAGALTIGATVGNNNLTLGGAASTVQIPGNLTVSGTTTTVNTDILDVEDKNITINKGGNDASSAGAGLTVDRTGTKGSLIYDNAAATKWKAGAQGSEVELADISTTQSLSGKTLVEPKIDNFMDINEETAPGSPAAGAIRVYAKNDGKIYKKDSAGTETEIGAGGSGAGSGSAGKNYLAEWYDATKTIEISATTLGPTSSRTVNGIDDKKWAVSTVTGLTIVNNTTDPSRFPRDLKIDSSNSNVLAFVETPLFVIDKTDYTAEIFIDFDFYATQSIYDVVVIRYGSTGTYKETIPLKQATSPITPSSYALNAFRNTVKTSFDPYVFPGVGAEDDLYSIRIRKSANIDSDLNISNIFVGPDNAVTEPKKVTKIVVQNAHGFLAGDVLYMNGSTYAKAVASAANTAEVVGVVGRFISSNQFELTLSGEVSGLTGLVAGEVYFLSPTTAGALTATEPSVIGQVSVPVGIAASTTSLYVAPKRGVVVGGVNARTEVALTSGATTNVQSVAGMTAGELEGWVFISSASPVRFYISAKFALSGSGGDYNLNYQTSGDVPPASFLMDITTAGMIRVTLPAASGSTSVINYALNAPAIGASLPLTVSARRVIGDTSGTSAPVGYVGQQITWATPPSNQVLTTIEADWTNATINLTAGVWNIFCNISMVYNCGSTASSIGNSQFKLTDSSNNVVQNCWKQISCSQANVSVTTSVSASCVVSISSNTTYKIRVLRYDAIGTGTGSVYNTPSASSEFYAVRIA